MDVLTAGMQASGVSFPYAYTSLDQASVEVEPYPHFVRGFVNRYNALGKLLWSNVFDLPCPPIEVEPDFYTCYAQVGHLAVDGAGNAYALAEVERVRDLPDGRFQSYLYKFGPGGKLLWRKAVPEATDSRPYALAVASDGATYVVWETFVRAPEPTAPSTPGGFKLGKFDADGKPLWTEDIALQHLGFHELAVPDTVGLAFTEGGDLVVAGLGSVQRFTPSGERLWERPLPFQPVERPGDAPAGEPLYASVQVAVGGERIFVGRGLESWNGYDYFYDFGFEVAAFDLGGTSLWTERYGDEAGERGDKGDVTDAQIAADLDGKLYLVGSAENFEAGAAPVRGNFIHTYTPDGALTNTSALEPVGNIYGIAMVRRPGLEYETVGPYVVGAVQNNRCESESYEADYFCPHTDAFVTPADYRARSYDWVRY